MDHFKPLFAAHIAKLQGAYEQIMDELGLPGVVLGSGTTEVYFEDDSAIPFRPAHHFAHWCPLPTAEHAVLVRPGKKPVLYFYAPDDFWHEHSTLSNEYWIDSFEIQQLPSVAEIWQQIAKHAPAAYVGPEATKAKAFKLQTNVESLVARLNWERTYKTDYEIACTVEAERKGARAHLAAMERFLAGGSELDIHLAYLGALESSEAGLPYNNIICLNEKGAILHYHNFRKDVKNGLSLLIDAGARFESYTSDITRTYAGPKACDEFRDLIAKTNEAQLRMCDAVKDKCNFLDLHVLAHEEVAKILIDLNILKGCSAEKAIEDLYTRAFFPHGLGHMLGIFVHDVAGRQKDRYNTFNDLSSRVPYLRTTRELYTGNIVTIEPGIYFNDILLKPFAEGAHREYFNWPLIEKLKPYGGVPIEDDVVVTANGHRNLTREFLP